MNGSRFHTDEEINNYSRIYKKLQQTAVEYYRKNYSIEEALPPELYIKTENGYEICASGLIIKPDPYLKDVYTVFNINGHNLNIDINTFKILSLTDISEEIDTSEAVNLLEWHVSDISNYIMNICVKVIGTERIFATCDINNINNDYFTPDYAQQSY